jgi:hypothetical protein
VHFVGLFLFITENARSKKQNTYIYIVSCFCLRVLLYCIAALVLYSFSLMFLYWYVCFPCWPLTIFTFPGPCVLKHLPNKFIIKQVYRDAQSGKSDPSQFIFNTRSFVKHRNTHKLSVLATITLGRTFLLVLRLVCWEKVCGYCRVLINTAETWLEPVSCSGKDG